MSDPSCPDWGLYEQTEAGEDKSTSSDYESFEDWLECYTETYETCGARHSDHYNCYWSNEGCEDPTWHDCFWYGTGCEEEPVDGYESGFMAGYLDGYADGVRDTVGPEPESMDGFQLQLVTAAFDDWVAE